MQMQTAEIVIADPFELSNLHLCARNLSQQHHLHVLSGCCSLVQGLSKVAGRQHLGLLSPRQQSRESIIQTLESICQRLRICGMLHHMCCQHPVCLLVHLWKHC